MRSKNRTRLFLGWIAAGAALSLLLTPIRAAAPQKVADSDISTAINSQFWSDTAVPANQIDVSTKDGVVELTGQVGNLLAKDRAEAIAAATVGVRAIINRIQVEPDATRTDPELAQAVAERWHNDPAADSYELSATAHDGIVTLTGQVDSFVEKKLAAVLAKGVKGVKGISNNITVNYQRQRPDPELLREIQARLKNDVRVDDKLITVQVEHGKAALSGIVGSLQEKNQAIHDAWVAGVRSVNGTDLEIQWWARDRMRRATTPPRDDQEIRAAVKAAFSYDPRVSSLNPQVQVQAGTVTLSGVVDNLAAKQAAADDAKNTLGVWRVKNNLKVRPPIPPDLALEKRVRNALREDPYVEQFPIDVRAHGGWVYLSGEVDNSFEKWHADSVAASLKGVVDVVNKLHFDYAWKWKPDRDIAADVKDQFSWDPYVNAQEISTAVKNGVVLLTGTVDSWAEYREAEKDCYKAGAKDVDNDLLVHHPDYGPVGPGYAGPLDELPGLRLPR